MSGPLTAERPSAVRIWAMAARPRTLPAAVAPVLVGSALAATEGTFKVLTFVAALLGALFIQVGTNLSNDYSDARRGADTEDRLGPVRVTAGGLVPPRQVLVATYVAFALAVLAGSYLIATAGWELLLVGAASILAGCSTPAARGPTATRGSARSSCSCSSASSRSPARTSRRSSGSSGRRSCSPCRSACSPRRSSSSTTSATSRPTAARASARWRCGWGASARGCSTWRWWPGRS